MNYPCSQFCVKNLPPAESCVRFFVPFIFHLDDPIKTQARVSQQKATVNHAFVFTHYIYYNHHHHYLFKRYIEHRVKAHKLNKPLFKTGQKGFQEAITVHFQEHTIGVN